MSRAQTPQQQQQQQAPPPPAPQSDEQRQNALQALSDNDISGMETLLEIQVENVEVSGLDPRIHALCNISALIALEADLASYVWQVDRALEAGSNADEVIGVLVAMAPTAGIPRMVAAAPNIAAALDIELDTGEGGDGNFARLG